MKGVRKSLAAVGVLALVTAASAHAQSPASFGLGGGITIPAGSTSDGLKTGWHGLALVDFKPQTSPVGFRIDAMYSDLKFKGGGGKDQMIDGTGNILYSFPVSAETKIRPYVLGGGGIYNIKAKDDLLGTSVSTTKFGINAGAGFDFPVSGATIFAEARFHNVFVTGSDFKFIPITVGVKFGGK